MVGDTRQGWAILATMTILFVVMLGLTTWAEQTANPELKSAGITQTATATQPGGNMEGKETRFGIADSALWAAETTAASNGSVNSMHDSYMPLGGMAAMWLIQLGEVVYGGVGSGLYGMLAFAIVAVFVAGLMVGRTPEYMGKKIESYEMKMAALMVLIPPFMVKIGTAIAVATTAGQSAVLNPGPTASARSSTPSRRSPTTTAAPSPGSVPTPTSTTSSWGSPCCWAATGWPCRPWPSPARWPRRRSVPAGAGTLPTHTPLFIVWLVAVVVIVGALSFFPALALGPIVEHLMIFR